MIHHYQVSAATNQTNQTDPTNQIATTPSAAAALPPGHLQNLVQKEAVLVQDLHPVGGTTGVRYATGGFLLVGLVHVCTW